ncbi:LLM class F420-dependent oxidoreductase [Nocardia sp. NPDC052566]|uniref:LLM class F420-dependent oxidoreductase n=1 Tax=Nocardia sp. NPDC052566 TaxID=3364330 RepID=UPI0037CCB18F
MAVQRPFRFGVNMLSSAPRRQWIEKCRRAEQLGFDVISVCDHLGLYAPFPAMVSAAEATERVRINTFVLNTPFYNPVLLAREVAGTDLLIDGRMELGLGIGYVKEEFEAAGLPFPTPGKRIAHLTKTIETLRKLFADPDYKPSAAQPGGPPLMIAGWGDRLLRLAAEQADIIALPGGAAAHDGGPLLFSSAEKYDERVAYVNGLLGARAGQVELNVLYQQVILPEERDAAIDRFRGHLTPEMIERFDELPVLLVGTPEEIAQRLQERRERYGISFISVHDHSMEKFAPVIELLR